MKLGKTTLCALMLPAFLASACGGEGSQECGDTGGANFLDGSFCDSILGFEEVEIDFNGSFLRVQYGVPTAEDPTQVAAFLEIAIIGTNVVIEEGRTYGPSFLTVRRRASEGANLTPVPIGSESMGVTLERFSGVGEVAEGSFAFLVEGNTQRTLTGEFEATVEPLTP